MRRATIVQNNRTTTRRTSFKEETKRRDFKILRERSTICEHLQILENYLTEKDFLSTKKEAVSTKYRKTFVEVKVISNAFCPSAKEVQNIFHFIFCNFDPSFVFVKYEDEALIYLKLLKYPYISEINRSQLVAITPHSWPILLAALVWLVQLAEYFDDTKKILNKNILDFKSGKNANSVNGENNLDGALNQQVHTNIYNKENENHLEARKQDHPNLKSRLNYIFLDFVYSCYKAYLDNCDEKKLESDFLRVAKELAGAQFENLEEQLSELKKLEVEIENITNESKMHHDQPESDSMRESLFEIPSMVLSECDFQKKVNEINLDFSQILPKSHQFIVKDSKKQKITIQGNNLDDRVDNYTDNSAHCNPENHHKYKTTVNPTEKNFKKYTHSDPISTDKENNDSAFIEKRLSMLSFAHENLQKLPKKVLLRKKILLCENENSNICERIRKNNLKIKTLKETIAGFKGDYHNQNIENDELKKKVLATKEVIQAQPINPEELKIINDEKTRFLDELDIIRNNHKNKSLDLLNCEKLLEDHIFQIEEILKKVNLNPQNFLLDKKTTEINVCTKINTKTKHFEQMNEISNYNETNPIKDAQSQNVDSVKKLMSLIETQDMDIHESIEINDYFFNGNILEQRRLIEDNISESENHLCELLDEIYNIENKNEELTEELREIKRKREIADKQLLNISKAYVKQKESYEKSIQIIEENIDRYNDSIIKNKNDEIAEIFILDNDIEKTKIKIHSLKKKNEHEKNILTKTIDDLELEIFSMIKK